MSTIHHFTSQRNNLPNRRASVTFELTFRGAPYVVTYSRFAENGKLAELFIDCQAKGMLPLDCDAKDAACAVSLALQFGCPAEVIRKAVSRTNDGKPVGIIGKVLDALVARETDQ